MSHVCLPREVLDLLLDRVEAEGRPYGDHEVVAWLLRLQDDLTHPTRPPVFPSLEALARAWRWTTCTGRPALKRVRVALAAFEAGPIDRLPRKLGAWEAAREASREGGARSRGHGEGTGRARGGHGEGTGQTGEPPEPADAGHGEGTARARRGHGEGTHARKDRLDPPSTVHRPLPPRESEVAREGPPEGSLSGQPGEGEAQPTPEERLWKLYRSLHEHVAPAELAAISALLDGRSALGAPVKPGRVAALIRMLATGRDAVSPREPWGDHPSHWRRAGIHALHRSAQLARVLDAAVAWHHAGAPSLAPPPPLEREPDDQADEVLRHVTATVMFGPEFEDGGSEDAIAFAAQAEDPEETERRRRALLAVGGVDAIVDAALAARLNPDARDHPAWSTLLTTLGPAWRAAYGDAACSP